MLDGLERRLDHRCRVWRSPRHDLLLDWNLPLLSRSGLLDGGDLLGLSRRRRAILVGRSTSTSEGGEGYVMDHRLVHDHGYETA